MAQNSDMEIMNELEIAIKTIERLNEEVETLKFRLWYVKYTLEEKSYE
jgi:hypothetical protein